MNVSFAASVVVPNLSVPCAGAEVTLKVRFAAAVSTSVADTCTFSAGPSSSIVIALRSAAATGLSLAAATVIATVTTSESSVAEHAGGGPPHAAGSPVSVTLNLKLSEPLKFALGWYVTDNGLPVNVLPTDNVAAPCFRTPLTGI